MHLPTRGPDPAIERVVHDLWNAGSNTDDILSKFDAINDRQEAGFVLSGLSNSRKRPVLLKLLLVVMVPVCFLQCVTLFSQSSLADGLGVVIQALVLCNLWKMRAWAFFGLAVLVGIGIAFDSYALFLGDSSVDGLEPRVAIGLLVVFALVIPASLYLKIRLFPFFGLLRPKTGPSGLWLIVEEFDSRRADPTSTPRETAI